MDLHKEFVKLSFDIIKMKNKLISLLLEIYEQEIYKQHSCRTIHEYGFKYAKLSKEMVDKAIRTLKHLENKPFLKQAIETQGIHKVAMVATIATPENERIFARHVENLSKPALFEFSKELRWKQRYEKAMNQETLFSGQTKDVQRNGTGTPQPGAVEMPHPCASERSQPGSSEAPQFCQAVPSKMTIELDAEMQILFLKFKEKYAKNLSNREALRVMLKRIDENSVPGNGIAKHHEVTNKSSPQGRVDEAVRVFQVFPSRYIQKKRDREIRKKYQHKCAYPGCVKTVGAMHHRVPFAFEKSHESVVPLCNVHHEFAHNGVIGHELKEPEEWTLEITGSKSIYDSFYLDKKPREYRQIII